MTRFSSAEALSALLHAQAGVRSSHVAESAATRNAAAVASLVAALLAALEDENAGVRWQAAYALAAVGRPALAPLLADLSTRPLSAWFATGAARVLRRLAPVAPELHLAPLIRLLCDPQAQIGAPIEAHRLLAELRSEERPA